MKMSLKTRIIVLNYSSRSWFCFYFNREKFGVICFVLKVQELITQKRAKSMIYMGR